jgi:hypothetical protein
MVPDLPRASVISHGEDQVASACHDLDANALPKVGLGLEDTLLLSRIKNGCSGIACPVLSIVGRGCLKISPSIFSSSPNLQHGIHVWDIMEN